MPKSGIEIRAERRSAGLCPLCGKGPPTEGYRSCDACRDRAARNTQRRSDRLAAKQQCVRCGAPAPAGHTYCVGCRDRVRAGNLARYRPRREHLCRSCGAPDHNARTCPQRKKNLGRGRIVQDMILTMLHLREARTLKALATETHIAWRTQYRIVEQLVEAGIPIRQVDTSATGAAVYQLDKEAMRLLLRL